MQRRVGLHQTQLRRLGDSGSGSSSTSSSLSAGTFAAETLALAQLMMPGVGIDRCEGSDLVKSWEVALPAGAGNFPTLDPFFDGGVLVFPAVASQFYLAPSTPGGVAFNPILAQFSCRSRAWVLRGRFFCNFNAFTAATSITFLSLDDGATGNNKIQMISNGAADPQQTYIRLKTGATTADVSTGPDGLLGGTGGIPINQWWYGLLYFDLFSIGWRIQDATNPLNKLNALTNQMDAMPDNATFAGMLNGDTTNGPALWCDGLALAYCSTRRNK